MLMGIQVIPRNLLVANSAQLNIVVCIDMSRYMKHYFLHYTFVLRIILSSQYYSLQVFLQQRFIFDKSLSISKNIFLCIQFFKDKYTFSEVSNTLFHCLLDSIAADEKSAVSITLDRQVGRQIWSFLFFSGIHLKISMSFFNSVTSL